MKRRVMRLLGVAMALVMFASMQLSAYATTRASDYFWVTEVWATPLEDGKFIVEFDIGTTQTMQEVGAKKIWIYEQQSDGKYEIVKTFTRDDTDGLIDTNATCAYACVTYQGTPGVKYFAMVALYAKDNNGSETKYRDTNVITAPN